MQTTKIVWKGHVYPSGLTIDAAHKGIRYSATDGTLAGTIDIAVANSVITVAWESENYRSDYLLATWVHSRKLVTVLVDLIAFRMGVGATVVLDQYQIDNSAVENISILDPNVAGLATSIQSDVDLLEVFGIVTREQHLMVVFEDLISTLSSEEHKAVNCGRCIEAIRRLVAENEPDHKKQWPIMRDMLNLDLSYLLLITNSSIEPRHGGSGAADPKEVAEVLRRTWVIIDRFFHFRKAGSRKLDLVRFPLLRM